MRSQTLRRPVLWLLLIASSVWLGGCALPRAPATPMASLAVQADPARTSTTLIVFLPGAQEVPQDIVDEGLVAQVHQMGLDADVIVADAHMGYFRNGSFEQRLREDVMLPARAQGYQTIWLAGISLGGFGAMRYAQEHPDEVAGIVALAPFVATRLILQEVSGAGGLLRWQPGEPVGAGDYQRELLVWLKGYADPKAVRPPLYMGYGSSDRLQPFEPLMDPLLPPDHRLAAPGGHDWAPWKQMWRDVLQRLPIARRTAWALSP